MVGVGLADLTHDSADVRQTLIKRSPAIPHLDRTAWQEWLVIAGRVYRRSESSGWEQPRFPTPKGVIGIDVASLFDPATISRIVGMVAADENSSQGSEVVAGVKVKKFGTDQYPAAGHVSYAVWFDAGHRLRQVRVSLGSLSFRLSFTETFLAFGVPVTIPEAPSMAPSVRYVGSNYPL